MRHEPVHRVGQARGGQTRDHDCSVHPSLAAGLPETRPATQADSVEEDAEFAIADAYWAVEEAEYRVLDATLARKGAGDDGHTKGAQFEGAHAAALHSRAVVATASCHGTQ